MCQSHGGLGVSLPRLHGLPQIFAYETVGLGLASEDGCSGSGASPPPDSPSAPVNVTVRHLKANSAVVSWDVLEDEVVIGFAISQQVTLWEGRTHGGSLVVDGGMQGMQKETGKGMRSKGDGQKVAHMA